MCVIKLDFRMFNTHLGFRNLADSRPLVMVRKTIHKLSSLTHLLQRQYKLHLLFFTRPDMFNDGIRLNYETYEGRSF